MNENITAVVSTLFASLRNSLLGALRTGPRADNGELPLRAELFSTAQMDLHGKALANSHQLSTGAVRDQLLARLASNETILTDTSALLRAAVKSGRPLTPAAEWLLDNFYLIEEQIRTAKQHLPKEYSKELPRLKTGAAAGHPRVYDIALEVIAHGDGRIDPEGLSRFVASYQQVTALKLGELWAIPIMLRLALIENLRRVGIRLSATRKNRNAADFWADKMIKTAQQEPGDLILLVADMARSNPPMDSSFVAELVRRLQGQGPSLMLPLTWLAQHVLSESGSTLEDLIQIENQQQAADQVSISNSIGSLRLLGSMDWREFVETMSVVEQTLRQDSTGTYERMDFATRDRYRQVIERLSKRTTSTEPEIASHALELARQTADENNADPRRSHVGYYLIDAGLPQLEQLIRLRIPLTDAVHRMADRSPVLYYLGPVFLLAALITGGMLFEGGSQGLSAGPLIALGFISLLATSQLTLALMNWLVTLWAIPRPLPRMDFSRGIPPESRTLVAVPSMLITPDNVDQLCEALEVRFLANRDDNLRFCLLTDFTDAAAETMPDDGMLLARAQKNIQQLNEKYARNSTNSKPGGDTFLLLHRPRRWNAQEGVWMGYERKRGKLADLNAFLRGAGNPFSYIVGNTEDLTSTKYVITLDTDTQLARESARQFVATMAHPLNRPHYDANVGRVTDGYGILQPRVSTCLPNTNASRYGLMFGDEPGIDPYTRTVSDVYQDVFREGSFIGKGIYDVDAFEQALGNRFPENRILSHDLLEGCYARCGLLSDVQLHEEYPTRYSADVSRRHRWIRGDWQLLPWLLPRVPTSSPGTPGATLQKNPLSTLSRWKLLDNFRRSLITTALMLLLFMGWSILPQAWFWTLMVVAILLVPALMAAVLDLVRKPDDVLFSQHLSALSRVTQYRLAHVLLALAFLPYEAFFSLDAIGRTLWRVFVSHRHLLEWKPSTEVNSMADGDLAAAYRRMWISPVLAIAIGALLTGLRPEALWAALPLLVLWVASPAIAWRLSQPLRREEVRLTSAQIGFLQRLARKTWAFFETYVGPDDNWLPPDNMQEEPVAVVAHRTSPTNIGLSLLANLTAWDFGYISTAQLLARCGHTLETMETLDRYKGHFYNWYDTRSLKPLLPMYISTVDSGNLAGHLLTLRTGLTDLLDQPIINPRLLDGINVTFGIMGESVHIATQPDLVQFQGHLALARQEHPSTLHALDKVLHHLAEHAEAFLASLDTPPETSLNWWARALAQQCRDACDELALLAPWSIGPAAAATLATVPDLNTMPTLRTLATIKASVEHESDTPDAKILAQLVAQSRSAAVERIAFIEELTQQVTSFARKEYDFLYNKTMHLLHIGYNVSERRRDVSYYDLLASEARLCSFVAIAQGELPQDNWFAMGRQLTIASGKPILVSWSGSMFEYLMPLLVMPTYDSTLLDQTYKATVKRQIEYGIQRGVPWGFSESGYNTFDASLNYQYRAFGVPGLGLKRGLSDDLVVAPYAAMLALMVAPEAACLNLQRMTGAGFEGAFGMYEAIDYTPARVPRGKNYAVIKSFMSHHQGMGFLSIAHLLLNQPMQRRFDSDPLFQATMLLLQERIPKPSASYFNTSELADIQLAPGAPKMPMRMLDRADTRQPEVQLLSNGRYHVMVTNAGGSSSRWKDLALTRWREDSTRDHWGAFCYIRDTDNGTFWSTAYQPTLKQPDSYAVILSEDRVEFRRNDGGLDMHTEIVVSPEDDLEVRRTRITNRSRGRRAIDVTSYCEVVLATAAADSAHPAFSNLFVQTEILPQHNAILCTRRPRSVGEKTPWMFTLMTIHGATVGTASFETDRAAFIGRGNNLQAPQAMLKSGELGGNQGSVLDPIMAIRYPITLNADKYITINSVSGVAETREEALRLIDKYQDRYLAARVFELAWTHNHVVLRQLNATDSDAQLYGRLANSIVYSNARLRADAGVLTKNRRHQSGLWGYGISGDLPIVLLQIKNAANIDLVRQMVQAHAYWRLKGLATDLVIWNEDHASYRQALQDEILGLITSGVEAHTIDRPGGIFLRMADQMSNEDRILLQSVARLILSDSRGTLTEQVNRRSPPDARPLTFIPTRKYVTHALAAPPVASETAERGPSDRRLIDRGSIDRRGAEGSAAEREPFDRERHDRSLPEGPFADGPRLSMEHGAMEDLHLPDEGAKPNGRPANGRLAPSALMLFNGLGGFTADGREYVITTSADKLTPAPWVNVLANPHFGSVISESGQAYTWGENAHEYRLTPWNNDAVSDPSGEAFYLRDEQTGHYWSPTPLPCRGQGDYITRHGFGYSVFEHIENGIHSELTVYVALHASIKYSVLKVRNDTNVARSLSASGYVEWVLGDLGPKNATHIITEVDSKNGALLAHNHYSAEFSELVAFFDVDAATRTVTGDRTEFLGRNGTLQDPAAMSRVRLSGRVGAALDPCAAIQVPFELLAGQEREIVFMLGISQRHSAGAGVGALVQRYRGAIVAHNELAAVVRHWSHTLGAVQIETPDPSLNVLVNGWLIYQTISSRVWARSGYYQSGGAYGFRDQLQDGMALLYSEPHLVREHLLRCAAHQFVEGDVQHWWHPPSDRGVRTHCSDDFLWLPLATSRYVLGTRDTGVLDENIHFIEGRPVNSDEDSYYDLPIRSPESASLYQHCVRAIEHGLNFGAHGLPLIGSCDWNDGMDKVGAQGKGESVWLGFFLYDVLTRFAPIAVLHDDPGFAERCSSQAAQIRKHIEDNAWDGQWYRRAYFDDGTPLGSASNPECQIDSISQSWSVLSGAGDPARSAMAMQAVNQRLVRREQALIQLLDPPFNTSDLNPGYIRGYVPGVRENGGQYTHAAIWTVMAFAKMGDSQTAWELLDLINPINHGKTPAGVAVYKVEPYVVAADVYAVSPHTGRGGWTWYTGSSSWMYRLIVESLLGLHLEADKLTITPILPAQWGSFRLRYRHRETFYNIFVERDSEMAGQPSGDQPQGEETIGGQLPEAQPGGVSGGDVLGGGQPRSVPGSDRIELTVDGIKQAGHTIHMVNDGVEHTVHVKVDGSLPTRT